MVGAAHTTAPHAIIYDTPALSRTSSAVSASTNIPIPTVVSPTAPIVETSTLPPETDTTPPSTPPPSSPPSSGGGGYGY